MCIYSGSALIHGTKANHIHGSPDLNINGSQDDPTVISKIAELNLEHV